MPRHTVGFVSGLKSPTRISNLGSLTRQTSNGRPSEIDGPGLSMPQPLMKNRVSKIDMESRTSLLTGKTVKENMGMHQSNMMEGIMKDNSVKVFKVTRK